MHIIFGAWRRRRALMLFILNRFAFTDDVLFSSHAPRARLAVPLPRGVEVVGRKLINPNHLWTD